MVLSKALIVNSIRGAFLANAGSMGTHWIYDPEEMKKEVPSIETPEFKDPPTPMYYSAKEFPGHYGPGMLCPYGEQLLFVTEYLSKNLEVDGKSMAVAFQEWIDAFGGRLDSGMKRVKVNVKEGKEWPECGDVGDKYAHAFIKGIAVAWLYAGKPDLDQKVEDTIRIHQNNDFSVAFGVAGAIMMEAILFGSSFQEAIDICRKKIMETDLPEKDVIPKALDRALNAEETDVGDLMENMAKEDGQKEMYGRSCLLPYAFSAPVYLMNKGPQQGDEMFVDPIRANIIGAGDTTSRAILLGAILGATPTGPPESWLKKMDKDTLARIDAAANAIAEHAVSTCPAN